jgi:hypothetical protein
MISIIRAGSSPERLSGSRTIDGDSVTPLISSIRRLIIIRKIDPEEFEDQEVNDMGEEENVDLSPEELDALEKEIPAEVDSMSDDELSDVEDDIDELDSSNEGGESDGSDGDMSEEELSALEKEIPPEVDQLKDEDLEADEDLESEDTPGESEGLVDAKENKTDSEEEDLDEGEKLDDYI